VARRPPGLATGARGRTHHASRIGWMAFNEFDDVACIVHVDLPTRARRRPGLGHGGCRRAPHHQEPHRVGAPQLELETKSKLEKSSQRFRAVQSGQSGSERIIIFVVSRRFPRAEPKRGQAGVPPWHVQTPPWPLRCGRPCGTAPETAPAPCTRVSLSRYISVTRGKITPQT